jgi:hypothetical protein
MTHKERIDVYRLPQRLFMLVSLAVTSGCTTIIVPEATGGSRADGIVTMTREGVRMFQTAQIDWEQTQRDAAARCAVWGYHDAQPFAGEKRHCEAYNGYGNCVEATYSRDYQCTGGSK